MSIYYKTGRSRTSRLLLLVTVMAAGRFPCSSTGATLLPGASYTTVTIFEAAAGRDANCSGYSGGFGIRPAIGTTGSGFFGTFNAALGVVVPNTSGTATFVPLVLVPTGSFGSTANTSFSVSVTLRRVLALVEQREHANNGKRRDLYGASGTCTEVYTVHAPGGDVAITSKNHSSDFVPDASAGALEAFGLDYTTAITSGLYAASRYNWAGTGLAGVAAQVTWSGGLVDASDNPLFPTPTVPTESNAAGGTRWGRVYANACPIPSPIAASRHDASVLLSHIPRHSFSVKMEPRALPDGRPVLAQHRIEYQTSNPIDGAGTTSGVTLYTSGESYPFVCGGTKWIASAGSASVYYSNTYNDSLPLLSWVEVTTIDANRHFFCHPGAPWDAIKFVQATALAIPGCASLSVSSGGSEIVSPGEWLGYRFLRITAHSTAGAGTLTISAKLNGSVSAVASVGLTTLAADTPVSVELDLLMTPGAVTEPALILDELEFAASGHAFVVEVVEAFVKFESVVSCLGLRRALYSTASPGDLPTEATPWIRCYTDGVLSLLGPAFNTSSPIGWWSETVRQLVQEIMNVTLTSYGSWGAAEPLTFVADGGPPPAYSSLLGWTLTDLAPPDGGKDYADGTTHELADYKDSDVYVSALHGDGLIGSVPLLVGVAGGPDDGLVGDDGEGVGGGGV